MEARCQSCTHWAGEPGEQVHRRCLHPLVGRVPAVMTLDGTSTMHPPSCLLTGPEFGCLHHSPRDCREWDRMKERDRLESVQAITATYNAELQRVRESFKS